jgi:hypothetical protein
MLDDIGPGSLKLIVGATSTEAEETLRTHVHEHHVRRLSDDAWVVYTEAEPFQIREWLREASAGLLVIEFERWSGSGEAVDSAWLLRRGH